MTHQVFGSGPGVIREHFFSHDVVQVEEFLARTYAEDIALRRPEDAREFACGHDTVAAGAFALSHVWITQTVDARIEPLDEMIIVGHLRHGAMSWDGTAFGEVRTASGDTVVAPPSGEYGDVLDQIDMDVVCFDADALASYAEHVCGVDPEDLRITGLTPISASMQRHWNRVVTHVRDDVLGNPLLAENPVVVDTAFRALATAFLATFPNTGLATVDGPGSTGSSGWVPEWALQDVADYLRSHPGESVGPAELSAMTGLPARSVVDQMRRRHGVHPARLLWEARLGGARRDLAATGPGPGTVATVAARWGFTRLGRFRIAYARAFGEFPEDTLRR